ncbi:hypothetical protein pb186bvf_002411 [Paramecium bursaria]
MSQVQLKRLQSHKTQYYKQQVELILQTDYYHQHIIPILQQNNFELIHQDIVNTQNLISVLQEHMNIINVRSARQEVPQLLQIMEYESNLECRAIGHQQFKITSINLNRQQGDPEFLCNFCNQNFQFAKDFTSIKKICEDFVNLKEIKEIKILQLQHYDQYLKKFMQLANLVEENTMYNYIKDKLTYFQNKELNIKEIFDSKFIEFLRPNIDRIDDKTKLKLQAIKRRLEFNNVDKLDINNRQILYRFNVDYNFKMELPLQNQLDDQQTFYGPKLTANLNYIQLITIHDPYPNLLNNYAKIIFFDENNQITESFKVSTYGTIEYNDNNLAEKFTNEYDEKYLFQINFYLFLNDYKTTLKYKKFKITLSLSVPFQGEIQRKNNNLIILIIIKEKSILNLIAQIIINLSSIDNIKIKILSQNVKFQQICQKQISKSTFFPFFLNSKKSYGSTIIYENSQKRIPVIFLRPLILIHESNQICQNWEEKKLFYSYSYLSVNQNGQQYCSTHNDHYVEIYVQRIIVVGNQNVLNCYKQKVQTVQRRIERNNQNHLNTQNIISAFQEHVKINNQLAFIQKEIHQQQITQYESNLLLGLEIFLITSINLVTDSIEPQLLCNLCNVTFQFGLDFTNIKRICEFK